MLSPFISETKIWKNSFAASRISKFENAFSDLRYYILYLYDEIDDMATCFLLYSILSFSDEALSSTDCQNVLAHRPAEEEIDLAAAHDVEVA
jgi:hypothetical protein